MSASAPTTRRLLRIAFDIGSGATKVCGAIIRTTIPQPATSTSGPSTSSPVVAAPTVVVEHVLCEREQTVLIGQAVKNDSHDGRTIPEQTVEEVIAVASKMVSEVHEAYGAWSLQDNNNATLHNSNTTNCDSTTSSICCSEEQRVGIATAIFRSASNGPAVLARLAEHPQLKLKCFILPQDQEAALGYETALQYYTASSKTNNTTMTISQPPQLVSYDSGAASFQLCVMPSASSSSSSADDDNNKTTNNKLRFFNGQWGSTIAHLALLKVVRSIREQEQAVIKPANDLDPNPVGPTAAMAFHKMVLADLNDDSKHPLEERLYFQQLFADAIGEVDGSMKVVASSSTDMTTPNTTHQHPSASPSSPSAPIFLQACGGATSAFNMCSKAFGGANYVNREALWEQIISVYSNKTNDELIAMDFVQPEVLVAKMILVYTVLTHLGAQGMHFSKAVGNTRAVFGLQQYWAQVGTMAAPTDAAPSRL